MQYLQRSRPHEYAGVRGPRPRPPWRELQRRDPIQFFRLQASRAFAISHAARDVGRTVRSSKRKFAWRFSLGPRGSEKVVELYISVVSGKRLLMYDGAEILNITSSKDKLHHEWRIDGAHTCRLDAVYDSFELSIDTVPFHQLPQRQTCTAAEADWLDARSSETAQRMASVATTPPPPTEEDLEQLARCVMYADSRCTRENALKFLAKRNFDPEQAAQAYTAMRDATPDQLGEDAFVEEGERSDSPIKQISAPPPIPPRSPELQPRPLVARGGTVTLADGTVIHSSMAPALPPRSTLPPAPSASGDLLGFS